MDNDVNEILDLLEEQTDMRDFVEGNYVRWIPLKDPSKIYLTNGGILVNIEIFESCVQIRVKNNQNRFFNIKFDEVLIFQKLSMQEKIIIKVLDLIDKS